MAPIRNLQRKMAPPAPYEEVVIDGDTSTDDDESVVVIPPQSRKRRRQSAIVDEDDEREPEPPRTSTTAQPTNPPSARTSPAAATATATATRNTRAIHGEDDDDDDDNEGVEIIQISTPTSAEGKRKSRRLTILESDDEPEPPMDAKRLTFDRDDREEIDDERRMRFSPRGVMNRLPVEPVRRSSLSQGPHASSAPYTDNLTRGDASSSSTSSRRSSRIQHKQTEKDKLGPRVRKLEFRSLDNCLDNTSARRHAATDDNDSDFIVDDEEEEEEEEEVEELPAPPRKRSCQPSSRERVYADGGDDLDDFIAADDEVEYMDDDEEGVMDQASSGDEMVGQEDDDGEDVRAAMQSREPSEWFAIYLQYLEECILDEDLDNKMRRSSRMLTYQLYRQASHHIERAICSRRDALRSSVVWNEDIMDNLRCATRFHSIRCNATTDCQACRRANHYATQLAQFGGFACNATELYKDNWMKRLRAAVNERDLMHASFELGSVCHARTLGYWQLLHAKHFWVAIVDAKRRESGDSTGRIADSERKAFYKHEYGRYKRLIALVDKFSTETTQSVGYMPNVWKKVTPTHVHSEFLPSGKQSGNSTEPPRRGAMDSLVAESDDDDDEEGEEEEEEEEEEIVDDPVGNRQNHRHQSPRQSLTSAAPAAAAGDSSPLFDRSTPRKKMRQSSIMSSFHTQPTNRLSPQSERVKADATPSSEPAKPLTDTKPVSEIDADDVLCLVCGENQRDGAVVHGNYLHFYCCFRCAKRQHAASHGCMVCDRPIDRVFRILPLSRDARADILKQQA